MNLTITKDQMLGALQAVQNIVSTRTTLPILSNVLIRVAETKAEFTATDLDVTISSIVECNAKKGGATTLPVKRLFGIARELATNEIELEVDDKDVCSLRSGPSFFKIKGISADEFPPIPVFKEDQKVALPQDKLKGMLRRTSYAISTDESRYVLNGIFFCFRDQKLTMVATDGRRLALVDEAVEMGEKDRAEFIVPSKAVNELNRLLGEKGTVEIQYSENQAAFRIKDDQERFIVLTSKLIEGNYPNFRQVIPSESKERISIPREELLHALRRAEIMTSEKQNSVKFSLTKNNLALTANAPDVGEARETIAINYKGRDLAIAFNPTYVIEPLAALTEDEVFLELVDELSPGVLKVNGPFLYVVMPMRLS